MRRASIMICAALLALAVNTQAPASDPAPTISADQLARGQKGYGYSVFNGTEPQRFEVEILGVLRNARPEMSYILARLSGQGLERSGVVAGMSGSPVYFDGRLAGAVAFSYLFGLDAVAGITPIDAMRRLSELPRPALPPAVPGTAATASGPRGSAPAGLAVAFEDLVKRDFPPNQLQDLLGRLGGGANSGALPALQWTASGFGPAAVDLLDRALPGLVPASLTAAPVAAGGGAAAHELVAGSSVAAVLVDGDLNLAAHGTVTDRTGDEILAFGHPMFSLGPVNLPLAPSEVVTVISSAFNSFKVSNAGPVTGAFDQDRQAGVRGRLGAAAPMTPLTVALDGLTEHQFRMSVANLPQMRPLLIAVSTLGALDSGSYTGGSQGVDLDARFTLAEHGELVVRQSFDGDQAGLGGVLYLLNFAAYLELNDLAEARIVAVDVELTQEERPRSATLVTAHAERRRVAPGSRVPVTLELQAWRGERFRRQLLVEIPAAADDGRYLVLLGDGTSMDAVRQMVEQRAPETFDQALDLLRSLHSRRDLVTYGLVPGPGLTVAGEALPDLPGSLRTIFAASPKPVGPPLSLTIVHRQEESLEQPIDGVVRIDLEVERKST